MTSISKYAHRKKWSGRRAGTPEVRTGRTFGTNLFSEGAAVLAHRESSSSEVGSFTNTRSRRVVPTLVKSQR